MILALYYTVRIILHPACYANDFFRLWLVKFWVSTSGSKSLVMSG